MPTVDRAALWRGPSEDVRRLLANGFARTQRDALVEVFGLSTAPCEPTSDVAAAHIFVWAEGEAMPLLPCREESSFVGVPGATGLGVTCPAASAPAPAGDAGLAAERPQGGLGWVVFAVIATVALAFGGRVATTRRAR